MENPLIQREKIIGQKTKSIPSQERILQITIFFSTHFHRKIYEIILQITMWRNFIHAFARSNINGLSNCKKQLAFGWTHQHDKVDLAVKIGRILLFTQHKTLAPNWFFKYTPMLVNLCNVSFFFFYKKKLIAFHS